MSCGSLKVQYLDPFISHSLGYLISKHMFFTVMPMTPNGFVWRPKHVGLQTCRCGGRRWLANVTMDVNNVGFKNMLNVEGNALNKFVGPQDYTLYVLVKNTVCKHNCVC